MILGLAFCASALSGCITDRSDDALCGRGGSSLTLVLKIPGLDAVAPSTRAMSELDENGIASVDALTFIKEGGELKFFNALRASGSRITPGNGIDERKCEIPLPAEMDGKVLDFVFLANLPDEYISSLTGGFAGKTKADVLKAITFGGSDYYAADGKWDAATGSAKHFPMWGEYSRSVTIGKDTDLRGIQMLRAVARIDVGLKFNDMEADYDGFEAAGLANFEIMQVVVRNVNTTGRVVPDSGKWAADRATVAASGSTKPRLAYAVADGASTVREIYIAESDIKGQDDPKDMTCILIQGKYKGRDGLKASPTATWYRVDFYDRASAGQPVAARLDILRNHRYIVNITAVRGDGYIDEETALDSEPMNMETDIDYWTDGGTDTVTDGDQYYLTVTPRAFTFPGTAVAADGSDNVLTVQTNADGGWSIDRNSITPASAKDWLGFNEFPVANPTGAGDGTKQTVTLTATANPSTTAARTAAFYVTAGRLRMPVTVTQEQAYFIAPPGVVGIGVESGKLTIRGSKEYPDGEAGETVYVVYFKWGSTVAIKTDENLGSFNKNHVVWTPPGFAGTISSWASVPYANGTSYPSSFPAQNNAAGLGDPCKLAENSGGNYRMPTGNPYEQFTDGGWVDNYSATIKIPGRWSDYGAAKSQFYPAAGVISFNGGFSNLRSQCRYWSSNVKDNNLSYYLYAHNAGADPLANQLRSCGFAVRCVEKEVRPEGYADVLYFKGDGTLDVGHWGDGNVTQANLAFFKFGSVVGFTVLSSDDSWDSGTVQFNPVTGNPSYGSNYEDIPCYAAADWDANLKNISDNSYHNIANVKAGKGDPARLVGMTAAQIQACTTDAQLYALEASLKTAGKGGWRTATMEENCVFVSGTTSTSIFPGTDRAYYPNPSTTDNGASFKNAPNLGRAYFPACANGTFVDNGYSPMYAAGFRGTTGISAAVGVGGYYWSSTASDDNRYGCRLYINYHSVNPSIGVPHVNGFGVRAVRR